ncbi:MAG TPA: bifunctional GNAT family N-acetyltransferase/GrpB family protein [Solirubrobacterales bacterium]|nr:bifunctional GNAT family N-acetyltransferase/GrpB family protein [Solirubrobacterales bacterium]
MTNARFEAIGLDDPRLPPLFADFIRETDGPLGIDLEAEIAAGLPADLRPPDGTLLLIVVDGEPAGLGGIRHLDTEVAEVKSMYVARPHRGRGLARELLSELEGTARRHGCRAVRLDTSDYLTAAIGLYAAAGYREVPDYNANPKANLWFERRLDDEPIHLAPYDPDWPVAFERERNLLAATIGAWVPGGIHHVGSTAVPGLEAKPILDILVGVADLEGSRACFEPLADLEYLYASYRSSEMHWFCKPHPSRRTHHLHLVPSDSPRYVAELSFRDRLRADAGLAQDYLALKRDLADRFPHDREAYTDAKSDFISRALRP